MPTSVEYGRSYQEWGVRLDCKKNGCPEPHSDDGQVFPASHQFGPPEDYARKMVKHGVNRHAVSLVTRIVPAWHDAR